MRVLPCGERALLVELDSLDAVLALHARIVGWASAGESPWNSVVDAVPAARTLLLTTADAVAPAALRAALSGVQLTADKPQPDAQATVTLEVTYDGEDLAEVASWTGLTTDEVVAAHTGRPWRVGFGGFAPGFAYLVGGDPRLAVPRRAEPRPSVPAGSVGLAGAFSGVYPQSSPGGWRLIGRTSATLWDADRTPPALLTAGAWVQFVAVSR